MNLRMWQIPLLVAVAFFSCVVAHDRQIVSTEAREEAALEAALRWAREASWPAPAVSCSMREETRALCYVFARPGAGALILSCPVYRGLASGWLPGRCSMAGEPRQEVAQ